MGYAIAAAAVEWGAETVLISGPTSLDPPHGVSFESVESTHDLHEAVQHHFEEADVLIMAAAPSDYRPARASDTKLKRSGSLALHLEPTVDILRSLASDRRKGRIVVGFALETDNGIENARKKLAEKHLDIIVLNQPGRDSGFLTDTNRVTILRPNAAPEEWPLLSKEEVARRLMVLIAELFS
jgi:phosphopantothenoylcysteine decarboxylase/phosphopantothenate--cysteine ligase